MSYPLSTMQRRTVLRQAVAIGGVLSASAALPSLALAQSNPASASRSAKNGLPRIVSVNGAITEVIYALGAQAQLVGTDTTSLYPEAALATPKVGYMRQLSAEGLLSLKPDVLLATSDAGPPAVLDQVRSAGVKVEMMESDHTWGEVQRLVTVVGNAAAQQARAKALLADLNAQWAATQKLVAAARGPKRRVLFILAHSGTPQVSGSKTGADALIRFAGGVNAIDGFAGYRPMTAEAMAVAAPDLILTTTQGITAAGGIDKFWARPELELTPAYRNRVLVHMDALELLGFGPRLPATVATLHRRLLTA
ncbi:heme/hemin ABC transporter substrate-binding protein [Rhodoferax saidenbachensis]|uniref:ABC transporter substrate-binding protein n=1 Tax=Rhodoferax saidenbachensis TaxID=1484693 RepID=A0A1P8K995_9BURK|nr:ABC transporter substrate-binding protein [Rhodoferax saidenbachensis]APW42576.1 ABC transporter substrate-binding protein [Rhodoferax saidenbachensis]